MIKIEYKVNCCGCSACYNICPKNCINMISDEEGFLYPTVDENICINCGMCEKVCPIMIDTPLPENLPKAFVVQSKSDDVLNSSTSGGFVDEVCQEVLKIGGVVFGVGFNKNFMPEHIMITSDRDRKLIAGSKYVQSDLGKVFGKIKELLLQNKKVLFIGVPCQVGGLKRKSIPRPEARDSFFMELNSLGFEQTIKKYVKVSLKDKNLELIRPILIKFKNSF